MSADFANDGHVTLDSGSLVYLTAKAEQTAGALDIHDAEVSIKNANAVLNIYGGEIIGNGTVDGNLVLGYDPATGQETTTAAIDPGWDVFSFFSADISYTTGTLTILDSLQMYPGSAMLIDQNRTDHTFDKIVASSLGWANLAGTLLFNNDPTYQPPDNNASIAFLTAGSINGQFDSIIASSSPIWWDPDGAQFYHLELHQYSGSYNWEVVAGLM